MKRVQHLGPTEKDTIKEVFFLMKPEKLNIITFGYSITYDLMKALEIFFDDVIKCERKEQILPLPSLKRA